jgi:hypothetical protein
MLRGIPTDDRFEFLSLSVTETVAGNTETHILAD